MLKSGKNKAISRLADSSESENIHIHSSTYAFSRGWQFSR